MMMPLLATALVLALGIPGPYASPTQRAQYWHQRGSHLQRLGRTRKATAALIRAVELQASTKNLRTLLIHLSRHHIPGTPIRYLESMPPSIRIAARRWLRVTDDRRLSTIKGYLSGSLPAGALAAMLTLACAPGLPEAACHAALSRSLWHLQATLPLYNRLRLRRKPLWRFAQADRRAGRLRLALRLLQLLSSDGRGDALWANALLAQAEIAYQLGRPARSLALLKRVLKYADRTAWQAIDKAGRRLTFVAVALYKPEGVWRLLQQTTPGRSAQLMVAAAFRYRQRGQLDDAVACFRRVALITRDQIQAVYAAFEHLLLLERQRQRYLQAAIFWIDHFQRGDATREPERRAHWRRTLGWRLVYHLQRDRGASNSTTLAKLLSRLQQRFANAGLNRRLRLGLWSVRFRAAVEENNCKGAMGLVRELLQRTPVARHGRAAFKGLVLPKSRLCQRARGHLKRKLGLAAGDQ